MLFGVSKSEHFSAHMTQKTSNEQWRAMKRAFDVQKIKHNQPQTIVSSMETPVRKKHPFEK